MLDNLRKKELEVEVIKTLVFFDLFNQPLSLFEIYKYLSIKTSLSELSEVLDLLNDKIKIKNGFYYLTDREEIVVERFKRYNYFKRKIKIARKFSKLISVFPFIKGVSISNIIANHNLRNNSDIDFFIITSQTKIWLSRFVCSSLAKILNLRPNKKTKQDKICLSFYISEDNLNLEKYLYNQDDLYFVYWILGLEVLVNKDNIFKKFKYENNWINKYLPNFLCFVTPAKAGVQLFVDLDSRLRGNDKDEDSFLEKFSKKIQLKIMPQKLKCQNSNSGGVILQDNIIKLFLEDKRPEFISRYKENLKKYL